MLRLLHWPVMAGAGSIPRVHGIVETCINVSLSKYKLIESDKGTKKSKKRGQEAEGWN